MAEAVKSSIERRGLLDIDEHAKPGSRPATSVDAAPPIVPTVAPLEEVVGLEMGIPGGLNLPVPIPLSE